MTLHEEISALCQGAKDASFKIGLASEDERNNLLTNNFVSNFHNSNLVG